MAIKLAESKLTNPYLKPHTEERRYTLQLQEARKNAEDRRKRGDDYFRTHGYIASP